MEMDFTSKDKKELRRFGNEVYTLFKVKGKIRRCTTNKYGETYNIGINSSVIARILYLCGVPPGNKVLIPFKLPNWIKRDKECFRIFVKRMFSCEGSINYDSNRIMPQIRLDMWKSEKYLKQSEEFIKDVAKYLNKYFEIKSTIRKVNIYNTRKDGIITRPIRMYITGISVIKFYKEIGFTGEKQKKIEKILGNPGFIETYGDLVRVKTKIRP